MTGKRNCPEEGRQAGTGEEGRQAGTGEEGRQAGTGEEGRQAGTGEEGGQACTGEEGGQAGTGEEGGQACTGEEGRQACTGEEGRQACTNQEASAESRQEGNEEGRHACADQGNGPRRRRRRQPTALPNIYRPRSKRRGLPNRPWSRPARSSTSWVDVCRSHSTNFSRIESAREACDRRRSWYWRPLRLIGRRVTTHNGAWSDGRT